MLLKWLTILLILVLKGGEKGGTIVAEGTPENLVA